MGRWMRGWMHGWMHGCGGMRAWLARWVLYPSMCTLAYSSVLALAWCACVNVRLCMCMHACVHNACGLRTCVRARVCAAKSEIGTLMDLMLARTWIHYYLTPLPLDSTTTQIAPPQKLRYHITSLPLDSTATEIHQHIIPSPFNSTTT